MSLKPFEPVPGITLNNVRANHQVVKDFCNEVHERVSGYHGAKLHRWPSRIIVRNSQDRNLFFGYDSHEVVVRRGFFGLGRVAIPIELAKDTYVAEESWPLEVHCYADVSEAEMGDLERI